MNKQELIKKIKLSSISDPKYLRNIIMVPDVLDLVKQLDEPQKKVIPKCAHEFILEGTDLGLSYFEIITSAESFANAKPQDEFSKWLRKNSGLFIRSLLNGYEVEKEPLYRVKLGEGYFVEYQGRGALIIPDDNKEIKIFNSKSDAERTAQTIGGTVEEVAEG
ncbi:TPA: DUF1642 domain-containing protein [Enterococcus faecium]